MVHVKVTFVAQDDHVSVHFERSGTEQAPGIPISSSEPVPTPVVLEDRFNKLVASEEHHAESASAHISFPVFVDAAVFLGDTACSQLALLVKYHSQGSRKRSMPTYASF